MSEKKRPLISVLLPVHDSEKFLYAAVQSILDQTYKNIELLILVSASTNQKSRNILLSFSDSRIRLIERSIEENMVKALSRGIIITKGEYIARMDADDISLPNRFSEQIDFMEENKEVGVCGTWYRSIGEGNSYINKLPTKHDDICANMLFYTSFAHPSVMIRKSLFEKFHLNYNTDLPYGEDYDLWSRCSIFFPMANIPKILLLYRVHKKNASRVFKTETDNTAHKIRTNFLKKIGIKQTQKEEYLHNNTKPKKKDTIKKFISDEESWLEKIIWANKKSRVYKIDSLDRVIYERWRTVCGMNTGEGISVWKKYQTSPLFKIGTSKKYLDSVKIFIKCILKR